MYKENYIYELDRHGYAEYIQEENLNALLPILSRLEETRQ